MAIIRDLDKKSFDAWVATCPLVIQELCKRFPPDRLYRIHSGNRGTLYSYEEDGTMTVDITGEYNLVIFNRRVFGVKPEHLEECDLPKYNEQLGTLLTDENEVALFINEVRCERNIL